MMIIADFMSNRMVGIGQCHHIPICLNLLNDYCVCVEREQGKNQLVCLY